MSALGRRIPRLALVHGPTPITRRPALDAVVGAEVWIKRDDMTSGAAAGNKVRKLELLLADAVEQGARAIVTCGGLQSNHARATALSCAELGLRSILLLRVPDPALAERTPPELAGNLLLDRLAGADIVFISPDEYRERSAMMEETRIAAERRGLPAYVIPEGGSNGLGSLGYVEAMREVRTQMDLGLCGTDEPFDVVAHACGSGGTAVGVALGAARHQVAHETWAFAVCDDVRTFEGITARIALESRALSPDLPPLAFAHADPNAGADGEARLVIDDRAKGPAYAQMSEEQIAFLVRVARATGLVLDPVYTGKALFGLAQAIARGDIARGARVLFLHTGGLPGLLAQPESLRTAL